jgi:hypothetical protein
MAWGDIDPIGAAGFAQQDQFNSRTVQLQLNQQLKLERLIRKRAEARVLAKKQLAAENTDKTFKVLFNRGTKETNSDLWNQAGKKSVFAGEPYRDQLHAGCKQSGRAVGHREPNSTARFERFETCFLPGGGEQERVRIARDQNPDWDSREPPARLSKNFRKLLKKPPKEFNFHRKQKTAQDMKIMQCRKEEGCINNTSGRFKDYPDGIKNGIAMRAQQKASWVGKKNFRRTFRPSTMEHAAKFSDEIVIKVRDEIVNPRATGRDLVKARNQMRTRAAAARGAARNAGVSRELSTHSVASVSHYPARYPLGARQAWGVGTGEHMRPQRESASTRPADGATRPASAGGARGGWAGR